MRQRAGKSQQDVAVFSGISHQQIGKYERGEDAISAARLEEICEYLQGSTNGGGFHESEAIFQVQRHNRMMDNEALLASVRSLREEIERLYRLLGVTE